MIAGNAGLVDDGVGRWIIWSMDAIPPGVSTRVSPGDAGVDATDGPDCGQVCHWLMV